VVNFGDSSVENEFTVSTYSDFGVEISEESDSLESAITRAEKNNSGDVITSKISNKNKK